jgi:protein ImuA
MSARSFNPAIAALREQIAAMEGDGGPERGVLPFGLPELDRRLPGGGLALGSLHEVAGGGNGAVWAGARFLETASSATFP